MTKTKDRFDGRVGIAHRIPIEKLADGDRGAKTTVESWVLELPGQSAAWDKYQLSVVTLRDVPDVEPALKHYPGAEYEISLCALDPELGPTHEDVNTLRLLSPWNYITQFHGVLDAEARDACVFMANALARGVLFAEPQGVNGARDLWRRSLADALGGDPDLIGWNAGESDE